MKNLFVIICLLVVKTVSAQKSETITLEWKIKPGDTLSYKTIMTSIEQSEPDMDKLIGRIAPESLKDSISKDSMPDFKKFFKAMQKANDDLDLSCKMTNNGNGIVGVYMVSNPEKKDLEKDSISNIFAGLSKMMGNIMLRGSVYQKGGIHSFWVKTAQKNLISMFFELPKTPVKKGDSWPLEVNYILNDQNFDCTKSNRTNKVTLIDIKKVKEEQIALLQYTIEEYVEGNFGMFDDKEKTIMHFTLNATAEFSVEKGRWISYEGILTSDTSGFMGNKTKQRIALVPEPKK
jgi:hypothetical protein